MVGDLSILWRLFYFNKNNIRGRSLQLSQLLNHYKFVFYEIIMIKKDIDILSLQQARERILRADLSLPSEIVTLCEAQRRITSADVAASIPHPSFDESTRDGFVISVMGNSGRSEDRYRIVQEIPAGKPFEQILLPGTACRIMTGGMVPEGSTRVVPFEDCVEHDGAVTITARALPVKATFIRKAGSDISQGERLIAGGTLLLADHLALLASCGVQAVAVSKRPEVGYVCTGSELISGDQIISDGQKVSSNSFLLRGMIVSAAGCPKNIGIIRDDAADLLDLFTTVTADGQLDALITTGGMGPGKYDLVEKSFVSAGGKVVFNAIAMRPGKAFLFGTLGRTLFFGLPGPPHAVRTLLHELVGPALYALQGVKDAWPRTIQAYLDHQIHIKRSDVMQLKDGVLTVDKGRCSVRFPEQLERGNCFIVLPAGQANYAEGDLVEVHFVFDQPGGKRQVLKNP